jgi:hypothetical protein
MDATRLLGRSGDSLAFVLLLAAAACDGRSARQADATPLPANIAVEAAEPQLIPMKDFEVRQAAIGCLQSPPYPADAGPICLRPDGSWIHYSGWGNSGGHYKVAGNRVIMQEPPEVSPRDAWKVAFFRDGEGQAFIRHERLGDEGSLRPFKAYPEAEYLRSN